MERLWLTRQEAADYLGFAYKTLENWAGRGTGPEMKRIGRTPRYHRDELERFIQSNGSPNKPLRYQPGSRKRKTAC
jgi:excisionase family DNA binding protein